VTFTILRRSAVDADEPLVLTREHELISAPRVGRIDWAGFDRTAWDEETLSRARDLWAHRAFTEFHSLTHFTQLASQAQRLGVPLDWSGAFARLISDETRHVELCLRMVEALGGQGDLALPTLGETHLVVRGSLRAHVRQTIVSALCIGETISGRLFKRCLAASTVPLAREVVTAILVDETFHGELGWELAALLMRPDADFEAERADLVASLPGLIEQFASQCLVSRSAAFTRAQAEFHDGPGFGGLSDAGYARGFFDGMEQDVLPAFEAIGLPEARGAWDGFVAGLR
jgi:hypothetical protein